MVSPFDLLFPALNVSYERLLDEDAGVGINLIAFLGGNSNEEGTTSFTQFAPYFRYYAGKKYASGFFVEAFLPITSYKINEYSYTSSYSSNNNGFYSYSNYAYQEISKTSLGLGFGLGGKWITKRNILFEVSGGVARLFGDEDLSVTGKGMLGIGYRF
jgi:hypothetical protein